MMGCRTPEQMPWVSAQVLYAQVRAWRLAGWAVREGCGGLVVRFDVGRGCDHGRPAGGCGDDGSEG